MEVKSIMEVKYNTGSKLIELRSFPRSYLRNDKKCVIVTIWHYVQSQAIIVKYAIHAIIQSSGETTLTEMVHFASSE